MKPTKDEEAFGENTWVYCSQHLRPHTTGWCTVDVSEKTPLKAKTYADAVEECVDRKFELYKG